MVLANPEYTTPWWPYLTVLILHPKFHKCCWIPHLPAPQKNKYGEWSTACKGHFWAFSNFTLAANFWLIFSTGFYIEFVLRGIRLGLFGIDVPLNARTLGSIRCMRAQACAHYCVCVCACVWLWLCACMYLCFDASLSCQVTRWILMEQLFDTIY